MTETLLQGLLRQAYLFDDPVAYSAGVHDAWTAIAAVTGAEEPTTAA